MWLGQPLNRVCFRRDRFSKPSSTSESWSLYKLRITKYHFEYFPHEDAYSDSGSDYGNQPSSIIEIKIFSN